MKESLPPGGRGLLWSAMVTFLSCGVQEGPLQALSIFLFLQRNRSNENAWWGVVLREPRLTAVENGLLLYLDKANMAVDSDHEH